MASDPDWARAADEFRKGGWIVALLGAAGALAHMFFSGKRYRWCEWVKRGVAGGLVGVIMYFALHGTSIDPLYKSVILSTCGALAPSIFENLGDFIKRLMNKEDENC